jgi:hypothetical protein
MDAFLTLGALDGGVLDLFADRQTGLTAWAFQFHDHESPVDELTRQRAFSDKISLDA